MMAILGASVFYQYSNDYQVVASWKRQQQVAINYKSTFTAAVAAASAYVGGGSNNSPLGPDHTICIYTMTSPSAIQQRKCHRNQCSSRYNHHNNAAPPYNHWFVLGMPSLHKRYVKSHVQGDISHPLEVEMAGFILEESRMFDHDILTLPYKDFYASDQSPMKLLGALRHGLEHNCSHSVIVEDDHSCVDITALQSVIAKARTPITESTTPTTSTRKNLFISGSGFQTKDSNTTTTTAHNNRYLGVSHGVASSIVQKGWNHAVLAATHYKNQDNLFLLTKWVEYAQRKHNLTVSTYDNKNDNKAGNTVLVPTTCPSMPETIKTEVEKKPQPIAFEHEVCIVTLTGADFFDNRQCQRHVCQPSYMAAKIPHKFIVGIPSKMVFEEDPSVVKNVSEVDAEIATALLTEDERYGDILAAPHKDYYIDLPEKRLAILKFGVEQKCKYTIKVDDEYCVNVDTVHEIIAKHEREYPHRELYFGNLLWQGTEYPQMQGAQGQHGPYFSGWCNGASYQLASYIVHEDWTHSVMRDHYGSSSEDVDMGFWVAFAQKKHKLHIEYAANPSIITEIKKGTCDEIKIDAQKAKGE